MDAAPFISQTEQPRCVVEGQLLNGGGICTVVLIRERKSWVLYPHGSTGMAVRIAEPDAAAVATAILDNYTPTR
jgi:hypothetical protein